MINLRVLSPLAAQVSFLALGIALRCSAIPRASHSSALRGFSSISTSAICDFDNMCLLGLQNSPKITASAASDVSDRQEEPLQGFRSSRSPVIVWDTLYHLTSR